jgi:release factor glutamine methyltransferase
MNIRHLLKKASKSIDYLDAEILLAHTLGTTRNYLITHPDESVSYIDTLRFLHLTRKRKNNTPTAYLIGKKEFYGTEFIVNKHTLVPRPDTETLVMVAIDTITKIKNKHTLLIDIGTGTGCIPISILKSLPNIDITTIATDISAGALKVARRNAHDMGVSIEFYRGNLLEPIRHTIDHAPQSSRIIITANLPYLTEEQMSEPSISREPRSALYADDGGLALYKQLIINLSTLRTPWTLIIEIDPDQRGEITRYTEEKLKKHYTECHKDLSGYDRVIVINSSPV